MVVVMAGDTKFKRTAAAWLYSATLRRFTVHEYVGTAPCDFMTAETRSNPSTPFPATELLYRCRETGTIRRWGIEEARN